MYEEGWMDAAVQSQNAVTAYFWSKQLLPFGIAYQSTFIYYVANVGK